MKNLLLFVAITDPGEMEKWIEANQPLTVVLIFAVSAILYLIFCGIDKIIKRIKR
jgi:hypothetical protein